jgi:pimeloyl-ACP methyl ester carboxylesterase
VSIDAAGRLARVGVPAAGIVALRSDLSSVMTRDVSYQNDADKPVFIPSLGFTIAATVTSPPEPSPTEKLPAVVLVPGLSAADRDEIASGIPIFGQLSGELAKAGFFVVRYDKRGVGQSGGRPESATLQDYADDVVSVVKWLRERKDIDPKRIALAGYSEGGAVALLAADRAGGKVSAISLIGAPGQSGRELILARQAHTLSMASNAAEEKREMVAMQTRILDAVVSGNWTGIPAAAQRAADTLMFKSWVEFDPAAAIKKVDQPILIVHGVLDTEMTSSNADRLESLSISRKAKAAALTKKVLVPGVNHLLVPATTGETTEYASLTDKTISPVVAAFIADWLRVVMVKR